MQDRIEKISQILDKNKAENIEVFDLIDKGYFVDTVIIATSLNERHNEALLDFLKKGLKPEEDFNNVETSDGWIVIDLGDILIHIMTEEYREKYHLDQFLKEFGKDRE
jgi:ribosome silencing factor RsfS/YbeB/iojap